MKKSFKAVLAMVLVLALGFSMLATTAFAASASNNIVVPQSAGIRDFFSSLVKKIANTVKEIINKIVTPNPPPVEPTDPPVETETSPASGDIVIDDAQDSGNTVGKSDQFAGGIW